MLVITKTRTFQDSSNLFLRLLKTKLLGIVSAVKCYKSNSILVSDDKTVNPVTVHFCVLCKAVNSELATHFQGHQSQVQTA